MRNIYIRIGLIVTLTTAASSTWAVTATIEASKDNSIFQNTADNSAGGAAGIFAGAAGASVNGSPRRGLIAFDVAANVPAGATITAAELTLHLALAGGGGNQSIGLHRLAVDWGEGTAGSSLATVSNGGQGFAAGAGDATWNSNAHGTSSWSSPGATGNFNATASASASIGANFESPYSWLSTPAMVSDVQSWLNNPATNFGWALVNANEVSFGSVRAFYSRSASANGGGDPLDPIARPALTVTYVIPEPTALVLIALAAPLAWRLRRR